MKDNNQPKKQLIVSQHQQIKGRSDQHCGNFCPPGMVTGKTTEARFGSFPSYHTWGAKIAAVLIAPAFYLLVLADNQLFFRLVIIFHVIVAIEEIAITFLLKKSKTNVASILSILYCREDRSS